MDTTFGNIKEYEQLYTGQDFKKYVTAVTSLPTITGSSMLGEAHLLIENNVGYKSGVIYCCRQVGTELKWVPIHLKEFGQLQPPSNCWKRITADSIILHWDDPADLTTGLKATWDHDVIVRKRGSAPTSIIDGEPVGCSYVRNQYDDDSIGFVHKINPEETDYYYCIFAVAKSEIASNPSDPLITRWTWPEIKQQIGAGKNGDRHRRCFRLGDIFPMPNNRIFTSTIYAQIVDFDHLCRQVGTSHNKPGITFMTVDVLGNKSFDNKELQFALTNDTSFVNNRRYFLAPNYESELKLEDWGYTYGHAIPEKRWYDNVPLLGHLYILNPSNRHFVENELILVSSTDNKNKKKAQSCELTGCNQWRGSSLCTWLTLYPSARTGTQTRDQLYDAYIARTLNNDQNVPWYIEDLAHPENVEWCAMKNGWYSTIPTALYDIAPASAGSASYINVPRFVDGFTDDDVDVNFINIITDSANTTITDQYVNRFTWDSSDDSKTLNTVGDGTTYKGALCVLDARFWIPSYEEIFGKYPAVGTNGAIDRRDTSSTSEGVQFEYFKDNPEALKKADIDTGDPIGWYLRTCDPTTPGHVFYVDANGEPKICTAHRYNTDDPVGPAVCFTLGQI